MESSHTPILLDQPVLVALNRLSFLGTAEPPSLPSRKLDDPGPAGLHNHETPAQAGAHLAHEIDDG